MNSPTTAGIDAAPSTVSCFHCGERVPTGIELSVDIDDEPRPMCCPGCCAVAQMIAGSGLGGFYRQRTAYNIRPETDPLDPSSRYTVYDEPDLAATFTSVDDLGGRHAALLVGGITCAACTWLIEQSLTELPGILRAQVNLSQNRLNVHYDPGKLRVSEIFARLDALGYRPLPFQESSRRQQARREYRLDLRRLGVAGLGMMQVGMFAIALHAGDIQGMETRFQSLLRWVSLPVAAFVVLYSARPFFESAWRHLRQGALVMDLPVALAIGLAFLASAWATVSGGPQVYFDSVVMFTFFLLLGRFMEKRARQAGEPNWWTLQDKLPDAVKIWRDGSWSTHPRITLCAGERILIRAGEIVPVDARIAEGASSVREDAFTGESLPRTVDCDDDIFAGTLNLEGNLEALALGGYRDTRLAALQHMVDTSLTDKPQLAKLADRVASWFVAGVLGVAALTGLFWLQLAPDRALWIVLSVLVISCPCALALATPAALSSAATALRRNGILVRGENALETLTRCSHLIFDKTGTLTHGRPTIVSTHVVGSVTAAEAVAICAALQHHSSHPMARAFATLGPAADVTGIKHYSGAGMEGFLNDQRYRMGSVAFCQEMAPTLSAPPAGELMWVVLCRENEPLAWVGLSDETRPEAEQVVAEAKTRGLDVQLLTGDSSAQGPKLAQTLGMDACRHGQSPEDKLACVRQLQATGANVCMVGDGVNDAPVLRRANTSFAVPGASDLARAQADFVLLDGNLNKVIQTLQTAHRCRRVMHQNITWALLYNVCAIPLAAAGMVPPWAAALGMSASSLLVVANSLRLNRFPKE